MSGAARMRGLSVLGRAFMAQAEIQSVVLARYCSTSSAPPPNISGLTMPHANKFAKERHRDMQRRSERSSNAEDEVCEDIPEDHKSSRYDTSGGHLDFHNALDVKNPNLSSSEGHVDSGIDSGAAMEREGTQTGAPMNATDRWSMQDRLTTSRNKDDIGYFIHPTHLEHHRVPQDEGHLWICWARNTDLLNIPTSPWSRPVRMFHTTPQSLSNNPSSDSTPDQLTRRQQLKLAVRDYGSTVMVFHITFALASLGGFYAAVSSGLDVVGLLSKVPHLGEKIASTELGSGATTFVIAYAVHKAFAPVRISVTLACAPLLVRYLRRKGVLNVKK